MFSLSTRSSALLCAVFCALPKPSFAETAATGFSAVTSGDYVFDNSLLMSDQAIDLSRFNQEGWVEPGRYQVDLFVNNVQVRRMSVEFREAEDGSVQPCLSDGDLAGVGIKLDNVDDETAHEVRCIALGDRIPGATSQFDQGLLRLNLGVPQALMVRMRSGQVPQSEWQSGETMLFVNYNGNFYRSDYDQGGTTDYGYLGVNSGLNVGLWRVRHQANYQYSKSGSNRRSDWNSLRTYVQRAVPMLRSELVLGESFTSGQLMGSMAFRGIQLNSDERMQPDYMNRYAPEVHGVARSNARVIVRQKDRVLHETNVPSGPFVIDDLAGTSIDGDLEVEVIEADGSRSTFTVPYTSVPESMRPGVFRYNATIGEARYIGDGHDLFGDFSFQYGLSNRVTSNFGLRMAEDYASLLAGGVLATRIGAFGVNATYSKAKVENDESKDGWRLEANYSKSFPVVGTSLTLAGYRYSTDGYRELSDVLGVRHASRNNEVWSSRTFQQRNQFVLTVNQDMGDYGSLYLSGSTSDYYNGSSRDTQIQVGYNNRFRQLSYSLSYTRMKTTRDEGSVSYDEQLGTAYSYSNDDNLFMVSISIPFGSGPRAAYLSSSVNNSSSSGTQYQTTLSGAAGKNDNLSYGVNVMHDDEQHTTNWGANVQARLPMVALGGNYSQGDDYWQAGGSARGAVVLHRGGLTFGPYIGDTFALIEAKGARGARVRNGQGARIDRFGYALVPSLMPYRYNQVGLDSEGINDQAELASNQDRVAPYAGASVRVNFSTLVGYAMLIRTRMKDGGVLPLGANVLDDENNTVGMVGQAGQAYARVGAEKGTLLVEWGRSEDEQCHIDYDLNGVNTEQALISFVADCK